MKMEEPAPVGSHDNGGGDMDWDLGDDELGGAVSELCGSEDLKSGRRECEAGAGVESVMEEDMERTEVYVVGFFSE